MIVDGPVQLSTSAKLLVFFVRCCACKADAEETDQPDSGGRSRRYLLSLSQVDDFCTAAALETALNKR